VAQRARPPAPPPAERRPLLERLAEPNAASKRWIFERYDQLVGSRTVRRPGFDGAALRLTRRGRGIAVALQGPPPGERDPWQAGVWAVLGAARNVACAGGEPIGLTDCLNFGNPEKPEIGWELARAIEGIAEAAAAIGAPVVSGNVSLYNETHGRAIPPTPVVGCVGLVPDVSLVPNRWGPGDAVHALTAEGLEEEAELIRLLWEQAPSFSLAHDVGHSGVDVALVEAALWSGIGVSIEAPLPAEVRAIVAVAHGTTWAGGQRVGTAGGDIVLGHSLDELRLAWERR
jgi:phosphoribosylformylglycinamidine (FGAM) synthase-like enzyme